MYSHTLLRGGLAAHYHVFVGDSYQHLGPSRGTVSAFDKVTPTHKFYLSQSFRFGPEVSYAAQCVLESVYGVCNRTVVGSRIKDSFVHTPDPRVFDPNSKLKRAYIAKSNFELYKIATEICEDCEYIAASMTFAGGMSKYGYDDVMDIYNLYLIQEGLATRETVNIQNPLVAKFETIASLTTFAKSVEDQDLHSKIMMFHYSGSRTPNHVTLLTQRCGTAASEADITFSTIGMAKGLEWDWVILKDDAPFDTIRVSRSPERRLLYVSLTRAKKFLTINSDVLYAIILARDQLQVLVARESVGENVKCLHCHAPIIGSPIPLLIKVLPYSIPSYGDRFREGYLCPRCTIWGRPRVPDFMPDVWPQIEYEIVPRLMLITGKLMLIFRKLDLWFSTFYHQEKMIQFHGL
ncbi:F-box DNA helicase 1-like [Procambarus clarkii]|uniref:F-box DNA helicase 1-like n=1 Tax=Procambarus clarkii TaxID=6728 RepID=UPI00374250A6